MPAKKTAAPAAKRTPAQNRAVQTRNKAQTVERDAEVWQLHIQGLTLRQIGQKMKLHHTTVMDIINRGVAEVRDPLINDIRKIADERWHLLWNKLQPSIMAGDIQAIEVGRKLLESWRKQYGIDGPINIAMTTETSPADLAVQKLIEEAERVVAAEEAKINGHGG
jgi:hypothetical protein